MSRLLVCAFALAAACTTSSPEKAQPLTSPAETAGIDPEAPPDANVTVIVDAGVDADAPCDAASLCGNGVIDPGEQCDDGSANGTAGDDCSATCQCLPS